MIYLFDGKVFQVYEIVWIVFGCYVIGNVQLDQDVLVWFNSIICGDNELIYVGQGINIQENLVLYIDVGFLFSISENCIIGYKVMLYGCIIGDNMLIGMGVMILNGVKIGKNCLIGVGVLIMEGKDILDGLLVMGVLGKVVCIFDDQVIVKLMLFVLYY